MTRIGDDNWILAYAHIAHDCQVGNHCVFSNNATLAGHVEVGDYVILSGFAGVHQFCRIGAHAFIGMGALVNGDVPPYVMVAAEGYAGRAASTAKASSAAASTPTRIAAIKRAYRTLYMSGASRGRSRGQLRRERPGQRRRARRCWTSSSAASGAAALSGAHARSHWSRARASGDLLGAGLITSIAAALSRTRNSPASAARACARPAWMPGTTAANWR